MRKLIPPEVTIRFCSLILDGDGSGELTPNYTSLDDDGAPKYDEAFPEDPRIETLRRLTYGCFLPMICTFGIIGNIGNLVVLTRRNMRGPAYIYMRGYSGAALLAILFAVPFAIRMIAHPETGKWRHFALAFYTAHIELFLGNACLGIGVMMLLVLTAERYSSVCTPGNKRPFMGSPCITVVVISFVTLLAYFPSVFRGEIASCIIYGEGTVLYYSRDNEKFLNTLSYSIYKIALEGIFKIVPTFIIAGLNLRIIIVYRESCAKRRQMTLTRKCQHDEDPRVFAEERRLIMLLGSTSILFLVCVSPMAILHVTLSQKNQASFLFQVFRALANLLELTNYSITFYIYCLFSEDFRSTLLRTINWPWTSKMCRRNDLAMQSSRHAPKPISDTHTAAQPPIETTTSGISTQPRSSTI